MNANFNQVYPLAIPFAAYVCGVLLHSHHGVNSTAHAAIIIGLFSLLILLGIFSSAHAYRTKFLFGSLLFLFFISLGWLNHSYFRRAHLSEIPGEQWLLRIDQSPEIRPRSVAVMATIINPQTGTGGETVLLNIQKDSLAMGMRSGNLIALSTADANYSSHLNPGEFDYDAFLKTKGIQHRRYIRSTQWRFVQRGEKHSLKSRALRLSKALDTSIETWPVAPETKAIARALLLGNRDAISDVTLQEYASAGAMHILAVSGLHTGIFYLVLSFLFRPLRRNKVGRTLSTLVILIILWAFALITGFSASVVRAVCMFSLISLAGLLQRQSSVFNTLISSAFILLLFNPGYLFQLGFQLSYSAVIGIVTIQPLISRALPLKKKILISLRDLMSVSIAAQIATLPLVLMYFKQFPTLFLLTNLIVIPVVSILMYLGLFCLILSSMGFSLHLPFRVFEFMVSFMNDAIHRIDATELQLTGLFLSGMGCLFLYLVIYFGHRWLKVGGFRPIMGALSGLVLLALMAGFRQVELSRPQLVIYHLPGHAAIGAFSHSSGILISDQKLLNDTAQIGYRIRGHWQLRSAPDPLFLDIRKDTVLGNIGKAGPMLWLADRSYTLYDGRIDPELLTSTWLVTTNCLPPAVLQESPKRVVLTTALSPNSTASWRIWCEKRQVWIWDVASEGPWIEELSAL